MTRRIAIVSAAVLLLTLGGWVAVNPGGEFGLSRFGVTTYSRVPVPFVDLQVRADGAFRPVFKSHNIDAARLEWLLANAAPDILIVAMGWEGQGVRVAIHVHSTCQGTKPSKPHVTPTSPDASPPLPVHRKRATRPRRRPRRRRWSSARASG